MKDYPPEVNTLVKVAVALFTLCLVIILAVWFLNSFVNKVERLESARLGWYGDVSGMLKRLRAFRDKTPDFYSEVVCSYITSDRAECFVARLTPRYELERQLEAFAIHAAESLTPSNSKDANRKELFHKATQYIASPDIRQSLEKAPEWFYGAGINEWSRAVHWIIYNEPEPNPGGVSGGVPVSYFNRFENFHIKEYIARDHLVDLLVPTTITESEHILQASLKEAYDGIQQTPTGPPSFSLFGTGVSIGTEDLLLMASPFLLLLQLLFLVYWNQRGQSDSVSTNAEKTAFFPVFHSPSDPFRKPSPQGLSGWTERTLWLLYLYLPTSIIALAVLTRYDLVSLRGRMELGLAMGLVLTRSTDPMSVFIDVLNLGCLILSIFATISVTVSDRKDVGVYSPNRLRKIEFAVIGFAVGVSWFWFCADKLFRFLPVPGGIVGFSALHTPGSIFPFIQSSWVWLSVLIFSIGLVWIIALITSLWQGSVSFRYYAMLFLCLMFHLVISIPKFTPYINP